MAKSRADPTQGLIFNIQRFSIQDGPGIRTTVFLKGCPLHCPWCSNPESIHPYAEIMARQADCIRCGKCVSACPLGASRIIDDCRVIDFTLCDQCLRCAEVCPAQAIERAGEWMSVPDILDVVLRDAAYYRATGGGLTISGGEPLKQWRFAKALAQAAQSNGIHVALDTSGYASWNALSAVLKHIDLVLYDLKHMDTAIHRQYTGVPNPRILKNLTAILQETNTRVWVRIPVIPGFNYSEEAMMAIVAVLPTLCRPVEKVSLLPFHQFGAGKYSALGRPYTWSDQEALSDEGLEEIKRCFTASNFNLEIGR